MERKEDYMIRIVVTSVDTTLLPKMLEMVSNQEDLVLIDLPKDCPPWFAAAIGHWLHHKLRRIAFSNGNGEYVLGVVHDNSEGKKLNTNIDTIHLT